MIRKLEWQDAKDLHPYLVDPLVFPYVRYKAECLDEYTFLMKQVKEKEENGELIMRVILDDVGKAIGQIALFDIQYKSGFLGTWLGVPYHGKGYNQQAKERFFSEIFYQLDMNEVYMKIRKVNVKSRKAALKLPYVELANHTRPHIYHSVNNGEEVYDIFVVRKDVYECVMPTSLEA
ncbi:N-acetyltransferase [Priestia megaterium]|nr:N-acetyltransferase [Priestia megaterium]